MGLDLELEVVDPRFHVSFAYSGFARFRERLAETALGIDLRSMKGFGGEGEWSAFLDDPLYNLLYHSDCDGELEDIECEGLASRIRETIRLWNEDDYDRVRGEELAEMIDQCAKRGGRVVFR